MKSHTLPTPRMLSADEIGQVAGGYFYGFTGTNTSVPVQSQSVTSTTQFLGFTNAGDRGDARQNAQLLAAYAANPDVPRSQVYADFFQL